MDQFTLTRMPEHNLEENWSEKAQRELQLLWAGGTGIKKGAQESLINHPLETASMIGLGLGVAYLSRGSSLLNHGMRSAGTCMSLAFANDVLRNGQSVGDAFLDNWKSDRHWLRNVDVVERNLGRLVFDTALFSATSMAFHACLPVERTAGATAATNPVIESNTGQALASKTFLSFPIKERGFIDGILEWQGKGERNPALSTDGPLEIAAYLGLKTPALSAEQLALANAEIVKLRVDGRGSMQHEKYSAEMKFDDGTIRPAIIRAFPHGWAYTSRFKNEQAAYHLNRALEFDNGYPTTVAKTYVKDGKVYRGWAQDAAGCTLEEGLMSLANSKYGQATAENVLKLVQSNASINSQIEQAFVERFILGDTDFHSKNMVLTPEMKVRNIDLDMAFHGDRTPGVVSSKAYGVNYTLLKDMSETRLSDLTMGRLGGFVNKFGTESGRAKLLDFGLLPKEIGPLLQRAQHFVRTGIFPEFHAPEL